METNRGNRKLGLGLFYMKMESVCSSETLVDLQRTTRRYIPEIVLFSHSRENLKSYFEKTRTSTISSTANPTSLELGSN
jgi:hypothetical protein